VAAFKYAYLLLESSIPVGRRDASLAILNITLQHVWPAPAGELWRALAG